MKTLHLELVFTKLNGFDEQEFIKVVSDNLSSVHAKSILSIPIDKMKYK